MRLRPSPPRVSPLGLALPFLLAGLAGCVSRTPPPVLRTPPPPITVAPPQPSQPQAYFRQTGLASYYGERHGGKATANGEMFDPAAFTAAHPSLAFGTVVRVTNLANGKTVKVEINDRGPHVKGRVIDLSRAAAGALGMTRDGIAQVMLEAFREDQANEN